MLWQDTSRFAVSYHFMSPDTYREFKGRTRTVDMPQGTYLVMENGNRSRDGKCAVYKEHFNGVTVHLSLATLDERDEVLKSL